MHRPALEIESFFRELQRLIGDGKIKCLPPKERRSAIYAAMLFIKYLHEIVTKKPPNGLFKARSFAAQLVSAVDAAQSPTPAPSLRLPSADERASRSAMTEGRRFESRLRHGKFSAITRRDGRGLHG